MTLGCAVTLPRSDAPGEATHKTACGLWQREGNLLVPSSNPAPWVSDIPILHSEIRCISKSHDRDCHWVTFSQTEVSHKIAEAWSPFLGWVFMEERHVCLRTLYQALCII